MTARNYRRLALVQLRLEMEGISLRLRSNLDYFGHPAGWVPQFSFAATLQSYSEEVKNDIPILYLAYYVQESSADRARHIASLQESVFKLQSDVKERSDEFNNVQGVIPGLEEQAASVQHDIELYQEEVVNRKYRWLLSKENRTEHSKENHQGKSTHFPRPDQRHKRPPPQVSFQFGDEYVMLTEKTRMRIYASKTH